MARNWIDGRWVGSSNIRASLDPATGRQIGTYAHAGGDDVRWTFTAAARTFRATAWTTLARPLNGCF
jgi:acyl-CoA reductase-like NAD-dependent aldehyde dehydrogenase